MDSETPKPEHFGESHRAVGQRHSFTANPKPLLGNCSHCGAVCQVAVSEGTQISATQNLVQFFNILGSERLRELVTVSH